MRCKNLIFSAFLVSGPAVSAETVGSLSLTSDYVHRGLSQSSGNPALQAGIGIRSESGYYAHLWATTLDTSELAPDFGDDSAIEANLVVGRVKALADDWLIELTAGQYESFNASQILDYDYTEFGVALIFKDNYRLHYAFSPRATDHTRSDAKLSGQRHVVEVSTQWPVSRRWSISGGVGYADLSRVSDVRHVFWGAGLNYRFQRYVLSAAFYGTDSDARERFIDGRADNRIAVSIIAAFGSG